MNCAICNNEIAQARLQALPATKVCFDCANRDNDDCTDKLGHDPIKFGIESLGSSEAEMVRNTLHLIPSATTEDVLTKIRSLLVDSRKPAQVIIKKNNWFGPRQRSVAHYAGNQSSTIREWGNTSEHNIATNKLVKRIKNKFEGICKSCSGLVKQGNGFAIKKDGEKWYTLCKNCFNKDAL